MRKLVTLALVLAALLFVPVAKAAEVREEIICPQPYGGGVVCGIKIHQPVEAGIGDNLMLLGSGFVGASALVALIARKLRKIA